MKTISLDDVHDFVESNQAHFPELGATLFSMVISVELICHSLKCIICPQDRIKQLLKRTVLSLVTTVLIYKLIEISWSNIASVI